MFETLKKLFAKSFWPGIFSTVPQPAAVGWFELFTWLIAALGQITGLHCDPHVSWRLLGLPTFQQPAKQVGESLLYAS